MSADVYRAPSWPLRPSRMPSRSTAWISEAGAASGRELVEGEERPGIDVVVPPRVHSAVTAAPTGSRHPSRPSPPRPPPPGRRPPARAHPRPPVGSPRGRPLRCSDRISAMRSACSGPYQATQPLPRAGRATARPRSVVADRVDRDVTRGSELLHAVPHDRTLYESSLAGSRRRAVTAAGSPRRLWTPQVRATIRPG